MAHILHPDLVPEAPGAVLEIDALTRGRRPRASAADAAAARDRDRAHDGDHREHGARRVAERRGCARLSA